MTIETEPTFGWQVVHDSQRNLIYYLHTFTGEIRWPRPETVGFIMHGLKPLPASSRTDRAQLDTWSPYYPHVVLLPSGLVPVHPDFGCETRRSNETRTMSCSYNRFPLIPARYLKDEEKKKTLHQVSALQQRLPPTWEASRSGSPFLPPYPVAILPRTQLDEDDTDKERRRYYVDVGPPCDDFHERFHTPELEIVHPLTRDGQDGKGGRVQHGAMDWKVITSSKPGINDVQLGPKQLGKHQLPHVPLHKDTPASTKGLLVPTMMKKEHNRKGYLLRQARKLVRQSSNAKAVAVTSVGSTTKRKGQETSSSSRTRFQRAVKNQHEKC